MKILRQVSVFGVPVVYGELCSSALQRNDMLDNVVNAYLALLSTGNKDIAVVHTYATTIAYEECTRGSFKDAQTTVKKAIDTVLDMNGVPPRLLAFPYSVAKKHWCLLVVRLQPLVEYFLYNPLGDSSVVQHMEYFYRQVVSPAMIQSSKGLKNVVSRCKRTRPDIPVQLDKFNCGVFVCTVVEYLLKKVEFQETWTEEDLYYFRLRIFEKISAHFRAS